MLQIKRSELKKLAQNKLGDDSIESQNKVLVMISTSLAARTSYTVVGEEKSIDYEALIGLHDRLLTQDPPHSSPMEHCARAMSDEEYREFFKGNIIHVGCEQELYENGTYSEDVVIPIEDQGWCYNLKGFIPYRYLVDNNLSM